MSVKLVFLLAISTFSQKLKNTWSAQNKLAFHSDSGELFLNVNVMPSIPPHALEQKKCCSQEKHDVSLNVQNLVAFWGEIINAV